MRKIFDNNNIQVCRCVTTTSVSAGWGLCPSCVPQSSARCWGAVPGAEITCPAVPGVESQPSASLSVSPSTRPALGRTTSSVCLTLVRSSSATRREPSVSPPPSGTSRLSASATPPWFWPGRRERERSPGTRPGSSLPQSSSRFTTRKLEQTSPGLESSRVTR